MDSASLKRLEFDRVTAAVAALAASPAASLRLAEACPLDDPEARRAECALLHEAVRRQAEPGEWCDVGTGEPGEALGREAVEPLDGPALVMVLSWLDAARVTRRAWREEEVAARHPGLAGAACSLADLEGLRARLARSLDPDGRVRDEASPALARARRDLSAGERALEERLERWAKSFGDDGYATRHGDRFVAMVPAAGFPRRRGIVHDVSGSGHSLFVEPLEATDDNNRLIGLRAAAAEEERRVLVALASAVADVREAVMESVATLVHLDTLRARARWAAAVGGVALEPGGKRLRLVAARHPLLAMGPRRDELVPLDLTLEDPRRLLLVSGPNMGGKTVLLKTVGLSVALAHAAFPVPASEGSEIPEVADILVDLGDDQSVDRGLSTFAAHLIQLRRMAEEAGPARLLLCDELGAGTDPEEGAALGRALIERFAERRAWGVVTTHLGSLKRVAQEVEGVVNGSLDFDSEALKPLYRFIPGVPGASHALSVAARLGLPAEVLERARGLTSEESRAVERLLAELRDARRAADAERVSLAAARDEASASATHHRQAAEEARRAALDLRRRLTRESESVLAHARELWQTIQREARRPDRTRDDAARVGQAVRGVEGEVASLERAAAEALQALGGDEARAAPPRLDPGVRVRVRDLGVEAEILSAPDAEGRLTLRRGAWTIQSHVDQLEAVEESAVTGRGQAVSASWQAEPEVALEVDLRGMESGEALITLDQGLDRAVLSGLGELRVIHGVGRGVLRGAVERHLRGHPQVASQRPGEIGEGGRGVTVAKLR